MVGTTMSLASFIARFPNQKVRVFGKAKPEDIGFLAGRKSWKSDTACALARTHEEVIPGLDEGVVVGGRGLSDTP